MGAFSFCRCAVHVWLCGTPLSTLIEAPPCSGVGLIHRPFPPPPLAWAARGHFLMVLTCGARRQRWVPHAQVQWHQDMPQLRLFLKELLHARVESSR